MSIKIDNPKTTLEKVDAAANMVEGMYLAFSVNDAEKFFQLHNKTSKLLFEALNELEEAGVK